VSARRPRATAGAISRRRFVSLVAAGSAALAAAPALAATTAPAKRTKPAAAPPKRTPEASELQKEFDRQRASTLETLQTIRGHALPPGGDLPVVFRPLSPARKGR
jgi:hypothetical protein